MRSCTTLREAAVVMLADSVEAAVRSMPEKTRNRGAGQKNY